MANNIQEMVYQLVFKKKRDIEKKIRKRAEKSGIRIASTQKLYEARAENKWSGFTLPAVNMRTLTFDSARAFFRQVIKKKVGAFIFELARSEIEYTNQPMSEYTSVVLAAAIEEGFRGPLFFQGDHFQISPEKFFNPGKREKEILDLKLLFKGSIESGVYNIDIDNSPLVDLRKRELSVQQKLNYELTARFTSYIRFLEPNGVTISIGGEIGEIGGKNSTLEDLRVFMEGYNKTLAKSGVRPGLIKVAIQNGGVHGGIVNSSGEIIKADIDFGILKKLSEEARNYGMAGTVQHGASTLPDEYFDKFSETGAVEIHLSTAFQNIIFDSIYFPSGLRERIYEWLRKNQSKERKEGQTEEQFIYRVRKKALGTFKKEIWGIPQEKKDKICEELEEKFSILLQKLKVGNTKNFVEKYC